MDDSMNMFYPSPLKMPVERQHGNSINIQEQKEVEKKAQRTKDVKTLSENQKQMEDGKWLSRPGLAKWQWLQRRIKTKTKAFILPSRTPEPWRCWCGTGGKNWDRNERRTWEQRMFTCCFSNSKKLKFIHRNEK